MPAGELFGAMFFFLLFLAAVTSSLSMLQPGIAFLEEALSIGRKQSVALLGLITGVGCLFVVYFSKDVKALDTLDFWVGTFLLFVLATIEIIMFGWVIGIDKAWKEAHKGAEMRIPGFFKPVMKYVCPVFLLVVFTLWVVFDVFGYKPATNEFVLTGYVLDLVGSDTVKPNNVARLCVALILVVTTFLMVATAAAAKRWKLPAKGGAR
jgi:hypothetical protein